MYSPGFVKNNLFCSTLSIETTPGSVSSVASAVTVYEIPFFVNGRLFNAVLKKSIVNCYVSLRELRISTSFALTDSVATLYLADVSADFTTKLSLVSPVDLIVTFSTDEVNPNRCR